MVRHSRRAFLAQSSLALASGLMARSAVAGTVMAISDRHVRVPARSKHTVASFAPPLVDPEVMRTFARTAIEAATQAGARYADIRIGDCRRFRCEDRFFQGDLNYSYGYGLRAEVDGVTAFVGGANPTAERIVLAARSAVATARGLAKISRTSEAFAAMPVVTGEWNTPLEIDPFSVSPDDHVYALAGFAQLNQIFRGPVDVRVEQILWKAETRVFASSDGSMVTQRLAGVLPSASLTGSSQDPSASMGQRLMPHPLTLLPPSSAGFECVLGVEIRERVERAMHDLVPWTAYALAQGDVGRKELVLDGPISASVIGATVLPALVLDRVLGEEQDVTGTSVLAPPEDILGKPMFSPLLNVSTVTGGTHFGRMQWDDEGVVPQPRRMIERGAVVDYLATRANLQTLEAWYATRGEPLRPPGVFRSEDVWDIPRAMPGACVVESINNGPSLAELISTVKDGVVVRNGFVNADQQGAGGAIFGPVAFEVRNGAITRRLLEIQIEFSIKQLLQGILAVGGPRTESVVTNHVVSGIPVRVLDQTITAPAMHLRNGNITSTALRLS